MVVEEILCKWRVLTPLEKRLENKAEKQAGEKSIEYTLTYKEAFVAMAKGKVVRSEHWVEVPRAWSLVQGVTPAEVAGMWKIVE